MKSFTLRPDTFTLNFNLIFQVPIFVIPGGMLTWGFEAEAERLMRRKRERRRRLKQASFCVCFEKRALAGGGIFVIHIDPH